MNRKLMILPVIVMILSASAFTYFISHPEIDTCAPPYDSGTGLTSGMMVCTTRETPNQIGLASSIAGFIAGGILATYVFAVRKTKE